MPTLGTTILLKPAATRMTAGDFTISTIEDALRFIDAIDLETRSLSHWKSAADTLVLAANNPGMMIAARGTFIDALDREGWRQV